MDLPDLRVWCIRQSGLAFHGSRLSYFLSSSAFTISTPLFITSVFVVLRRVAHSESKSACACVIRISNRTFLGLSIGGLPCVGDILRTSFIARTYNIYCTYNKVKGKCEILWRGWPGSNRRYRSQNPVPYHLATPLWSWWTASNRRPVEYKSTALPTELHQRGAPGGNRTHNIRTTKAVRYRLRHWCWSEWCELNTHLLVPKTSAIPFRHTRIRLESRLVDCLFQNAGHRQPKRLVGRNGDLLPDIRVVAITLRHHLGTEGAEVVDGHVLTLLGTL